MYPYGATMTVQAPAHPVLSSGPISYPLNRPVAGVWERPQEAPPGSKGGVGSVGRGAVTGAGSARRAARPEDDDGKLIRKSNFWVAMIPGASDYVRNGTEMLRKG